MLRSSASATASSSPSSSSTSGSQPCQTPGSSEPASKSQETLSPARNGFIRPVPVANFFRPAEQQQPDTVKKPAVPEKRRFSALIGDLQPCSEGKALLGNEEFARRRQSWDTRSNAAPFGQNLLRKTPRSRASPSKDNKTPDSGAANPDRVQTPLTPPSASPSVKQDIPASESPLVSAEEKKTSPPADASQVGRKAAVTSSVSEAAKRETGTEPRSTVEPSVFPKGSSGEATAKTPASLRTAQKASANDVSCAAKSSTDAKSSPIGNDDAPKARNRIYGLTTKGAEKSNQVSSHNGGTSSDVRRTSVPHNKKPTEDIKECLGEAKQRKGSQREEPGPATGPTKSGFVGKNQQVDDKPRLSETNARRSSKETVLGAPEPTSKAAEDRREKTCVDRSKSLLTQNVTVTSQLNGPSRSGGASSKDVPPDCVSQQAKKPEGSLSTVSSSSTTAIVSQSKPKVYGLGKRDGKAERPVECQDLNATGTKVDRVHQPSAVPASHSTSAPVSAVSSSKTDETVQVSAPVRKQPEPQEKTQAVSAGPSGEQLPKGVRTSRRTSDLIASKIQNIFSTFSTDKTSAQAPSVKSKPSSADSKISNSETTRSEKDSAGKSAAQSSHQIQTKHFDSRKEAASTKTVTAPSPQTSVSQKMGDTVVKLTASESTAFVETRNSSPSAGTVHKVVASSSSVKSLSSTVVERGTTSSAAPVSEIKSKSPSGAAGTSVDEIKSVSPSGARASVRDSANSSRAPVGEINTDSPSGALTSVDEVKSRSSVGVRASASESSSGAQASVDEIKIVGPSAARAPVVEITSKSTSGARAPVAEITSKNTSARAPVAGITSTSTSGARAPVVEITSKSTSGARAPVVEITSKNTSGARAPVAEITSTSTSGARAPMVEITSKSTSGARAPGVEITSKNVVGVGTSASESSSRTQVSVGEIKTDSPGAAWASADEVKSESSGGLRSSVSESPASTQLTAEPSAKTKDSQVQPHLSCGSSVNTTHNESSPSASTSSLPKKPDTEPDTRTVVSEAHEKSVVDLASGLPSSLLASTSTVGSSLRSVGALESSEPAVRATGVGSPFPRSASTVSVLDTVGAFPPPSRVDPSARVQSIPTALHDTGIFGSVAPRPPERKRSSLLRDSSVPPPVPPHSSILRTGSLKRFEDPKLAFERSMGILRSPSHSCISSYTLPHRYSYTEMLSKVCSYGIAPASSASGLGTFSRAKKYSTGSLSSSLSQVSELWSDLTQEQSSAAHTSEMLEAETTERMRLEKEMQELQSKYSHAQQKSDKMEMEMMEARVYRSSEVNGDLSEEEDSEASGSIYKAKYERAVRDMEIMKRRIQQQHEEEAEQNLLMKKAADKKLAEALEDVEEERQVANQWKRKAQKLSSELQDLRLMLEEQMARNGELEKRQRRFDSELSACQEEIKKERLSREKMVRERDQALQEKYSMEQELHATRLDMDMQHEKVTQLSRELDELTLSSKGEEEVTQLKRAKQELERKTRDQEEELEELAGQVQMLEQAKLRLEMSLEKLRQEHRRENSVREEEIEELRASFSKKVKNLEAQLEAEQEDRHQLVKQKHELERRVIELTDQPPPQDPEIERRLRRDLKRTRALLKDAQSMLEHVRDGSGSKSIIRQLKNQLEDAEFAKCAAVKAKQNAEMELQDLQTQLEEVTRTKNESESRCLQLSREKSALQSQLEEIEEEMAEVMKKYKASVAQMSVDQKTLADQSQLISELEAEKAALKEQLSEVNTKFEHLAGHSEDSHRVHRLDGKVREMESKLELEQTTRSRLEHQICRLKEQIERLQEECDSLRSKEVQAQEACRRFQRQIRDLREDYAALQQKEAEAYRKQHELEAALESAESDLKVTKNDLRLACQRIDELKNALEDDLDSGTDVPDDSGSDSDSSLDMSSILRHSFSTIQRCDSASSDLSIGGRRSLTPSMGPEFSALCSRGDADAEINGLPQLNRPSISPQGQEHLDV